MDFGGGYGMFVRLMRDLGFDLYWQDKSCKHLFAAELEVREVPSRKSEFLTTFDVFEHLLGVYRFTYLL
jgi:hypothetical protein